MSTSLSFKPSPSLSLALSTLWSSQISLDVGIYTSLASGGSTRPAIDGASCAVDVFGIEEATAFPDYIVDLDNDGCYDVATGTDVIVPRKTCLFLIGKSPTNHFVLVTILSRLDHAII